MKKTTKVIGAVLSAVTAVSMSAAVAMTASASQYVYVENHNKIDCMHRYFENDKAVFVVKAMKADNRNAYFTVTSASDDGDKTVVAELEINQLVNGGGATENIFAHHDYSDETYDYFKVYADLGDEYDTVSLKAYFSLYADKEMATDAAYGSLAEGSGYVLAK